MPAKDPRIDTALRRLVDRVPDVVFRFRLGRDARFEYISEATTRLLGYTPEEFYAEPELGLSTVHPDDRDQLTQMVQSGDKAPAIIRYLHKDGSFVYAQVKLNPFYAGTGEHDLLGVDGVIRAVDNPIAPSTATRSVGGIDVDLADRRVTVDGRVVQLTPVELRLLMMLMEQPGRVVSRDELMRRLWRSSHAGGGHTCEAHISNLRKKIERDPKKPTRIVTVRGGGYRFSA